MVRVKGDIWWKLWSLLASLWDLPCCLFAPSVDWVYTQTQSLDGKLPPNLLVNYNLGMFFFHSVRELAAKALLNGPNPLHDYRGSHHQGGFIPPPNPTHHPSHPASHDYHFVLMFFISWLNSWVINLPKPPWALLVQLLASRLEATHTTSRGDGRIKCHISCTRHSAFKHVKPEWPAVAVVYEVCSLDSQKQRKSPGMVIWHTAAPVLCHLTV